MKKHFNITKSTSECQRLVAEYFNMEIDTEESINQKEDIFNQIYFNAQCKSIIGNQIF